MAGPFEMLRLLRKAAGPWGGGRSGGRGPRLDVGAGDALEEAGGVSELGTAADAPSPLCRPGALNPELPDSRHQRGRGGPLAAEG